MASALRREPASVCRVSAATLAASGWPTFAPSKLVPVRTDNATRKRASASACQPFSGFSASFCATQQPPAKSRNLAAAPALATQTAQTEAGSSPASATVIPASAAPNAKRKGASQQANRLPIAAQTVCSIVANQSASAKTVTLETSARLRFVLRSVCETASAATELVFANEASTENTAA